MKISKDNRINAAVLKIMTATPSAQLVHGGKHPALKLSNGVKITIPSTPGDNRSYLNWRSQVKRAIPELASCF